MAKKSDAVSGGFTIGEKCFSRAQPLVIAEIGTSHGGDLSKTKELIAAAAQAGAGCAKFQLVHAQEILHPLCGTVPLPGGNIALFERFQSLELPLEFYAYCKEETEQKGMVFLCTPFGERSAAELMSLGVRAMKVASPELNHLPLLDALGASILPTILSSGVSRLSDIEEAVSRFKNQVALLHCVTAYPAPETEYNLRLLPSLSALFGIPLGVSDHSLDPSLVPLLALSMDACIIEKHLCLSRTDSGLDDPIALDPENFSRMCMNLYKASAMGNAEIIAWAEAEYGKEKVQSVLGNGIKRLAPSEEANYLRTRRSIHAVNEIRQGEVFSKENLALLRTEKVLRPGLSPTFFSRLIGRRAARRIPSGEGIEWEDIGEAAGT